MRIARLDLAAVLAAALAAALSGCGDGPPPLRAAPSGETQGYCFIHSGQRLTYGLEAFKNYSSQTVVFDRVGLRHPDHLRVLGAALTPGPGYVVGMWKIWPPTGWRWSRHRPVAGYRLAPGASAGVALGFKLTSTSGQAPGLLIDYHTANGSYVLRDDLKITVDIGCPKKS